MAEYREADSRAGCGLVGCGVSPINGSVRRDVGLVPYSGQKPFLSELLESSQLPFHDFPLIIVKQPLRSLFRETTELQYEKLSVELAGLP
jgi:hypothetical protein